VDYTNGGIFSLDGQYSQFFATGRALRSRAQFFLAANRPQQSFADLLTLLRLSGHLQSEPNFLALLYQISLLDHSIHVAWEGIQDRRWDDSQLRRLQDEFGKCDLLAAIHRAGLGERLWNETLVENLPEKVFLKKLYKGWLYHNLVHSDGYLVACNTDVVEPGHRRVFPERWIREEEFRKKSLILRKDFPVPRHVGELHPLMGIVVVRAAYVQSGLDQVALACALERFRLARGGYPAPLSELTPAFIARVPLDIVDGQPLRYERVGQTYILYSVGWNLKDDGGVFAFGPGGDQDPNHMFEGDWPWIMTGGLEAKTGRS
jgi:hypothetical protein